MSKSLISSFLESDVSESLRLLIKNERFAHIAQRKWAIVSELLRLPTKNERMSESLISSFLGKKQAIHSENRWTNSQPCSFLTENSTWAHMNRQKRFCNVSGKLFYVGKSKN